MFLISTVYIFYNYIYAIFTKYKLIFFVCLSPESRKNYIINRKF